MSNTTIYTVNTHHTQEVFKPTYLYIKQHSITKKLYFGKTTRSEKTLLKKYKGGGKYWNQHIDKHGRNHVETIWYCLFTEKDALIEFALMCSEQWNIVKGIDAVTHKKIWANECNENGLAGAVAGRVVSAETCKNISNGRKGQPGLFGVINGMFGKDPWNKGLILEGDKYKGGRKNKGRTGEKSGVFGKKFPGRSAGEKNGMFGKKGDLSPTFGITRLKIECPHCLRLIAQGNYTRWHGDNCKHRKI